MKLKLASIAILGLLASPAYAEDKAAAPAAPAEAAAPASTEAAEPPPTPEELAEKAGRQACKVELCRAFHSKSTSGQELTCTVVKSWRQTQLVKLISKLKVTWPYGPVKCTTDLVADRAAIVTAMSVAKADVEFAKHTVSCMVDPGKEGGKPTELKVELSPKIHFENGKAVKAEAKWGKIEAPTLIKSALWTATAADNTVGLLSSTIVDEVNDFITKRCDEVKDQWAAKQ